MGLEHRRQSRLNVSMNALIKGVDRFGVAFDESAASDNISRGGLAFKTTRELSEGAEVEIWIPRPPIGRREQAPFFTTGKVIRSVPEGEGYRVAIQFIGPQFRTYVGES